MFNFLKNLNADRISPELIKFLIACLSSLHDRRTSLIVPQLEAGLLRYQRHSNVVEPNYMSFTYFPAVAGRFEDPLGRFFRIKDIHVRSRNGSDVTRVSIYISRGLICGYAFEVNKEFNPDVTTVDTSRVTIELLDSTEPVLDKLIDQDDKALINWSDVFEVEVNGATYFHLKEIGDGDFVAIDTNGLVYEIHHDPLEVIRRAETLRQILTSYEG